MGEGVMLLKAEDNGWGFVCGGGLPSRIETMTIVSAAELLLSVSGLELKKAGERCGGA